MNSLILILAILWITSVHSSFLKPTVEIDDDVRHMTEILRTGWLKFLSTFHYNETYPLHEQWFGSDFSTLIQKMKDTLYDPTIDYDTKMRIIIEIYEELYYLLAPKCDYVELVQKIEEQCMKDSCEIDIVAFRIFNKLYTFLQLVYDFEYYLNVPTKTHEEALNAVKHLGFDGSEIIHILLGMPLHN